MDTPSKLKWRPPKEDTIIFTQTSCGLDFDGRQACAVESAARHHGNRSVIVYVTAPFIDMSHPLIKVKFNHQCIFISDACRTEILRKYGGTYLDLDALTLRPLPNRTNYLGRLNSQSINNAVLSLVKGHPLSQTLANSIPEAFDPFNGTSIGPSLLYPALRDMCPGNLTNSTHTRSLSDAFNEDEVSAYLEDTSPYLQTPETCSDLTVFPQKMFYPINCKTGERFLLFLGGHGYGEKFLRFSKAYILHLSNSLTEQNIAQTGGDSILEEVMRRNCPDVHHYVRTNVGHLR
ncbi:alpha-1,4-N-acetylglucosaminyltransferase-like [Macrobrachium nipponense]|uniref:alpha-1,4-N-acetylglucosaminyltransferase-like n=1 Tax=Macrobrachium nipponense TaxID=159736 RepID=UPI0030C86CD8